MTVNTYSRYQPGLTLNHIFPSIKDKCACGCGNTLPKSRKKWFSDLCRDTAFIKFAIIKGDTSIIRSQLFLVDLGACRMCGCITEDWHADHIFPVMFGGGACDLSNMQTLCISCHKEKTYTNIINYSTIRQFPHKRLLPFSGVISLRAGKLQIAV